MLIATKSNDDSRIVYSLQLFFLDWKQAIGRDDTKPKLECMENALAISAIPGCMNVSPPIVEIVPTESIKSSHA